MLLSRIIINNNGRFFERTLGRRLGGFLNPSSPQLLPFLPRVSPFRNYVSKPSSLSSALTPVTKTSLLLPPPTSTGTFTAIKPCSSATSQQSQSQSSSSSFLSNLSSFLVSQYFFYADMMKSRSLNVSLLRELGFPKPFSVRTRDGHALNAIHVLMSDGTRSSPTVILFSGTRGGFESMLAEAVWYHKHNFNVLAVSRRGYSGSSGSSRTSLENGIFLDVEASILYLDRLKVPRSSILAHGYSLGGAYATIAGRFFGAGAVTLDRSFTSAHDVILYNSRSLIAPSALINPAISRLFPKGLPMSPITAAARTDCLNNESKVAHPMFSQNLYVFAGKLDNVTPEIMSRKIHVSRYSELPGFANRLHVLPHDHYEPYFKALADEKRYLAYLKEIQFYS